MAKITVIGASSPEVAQNLAKNLRALRKTTPGYEDKLESLDMGNQDMVVTYGNASEPVAEFRT